MSLLRPLIPWLKLSVPLLLMLAMLLVIFQGSENEVFIFFRHHRETHPALKAILRFWTDWINTAFYLYFAFMLLRTFKTGDLATRRFISVYIAVQLLISLILVYFLKASIGRPRPGEDPYLQGFTTKPSYHSMPSGHTTEATISSLALGLRLNKISWTLLIGLALALTGFSRIYLGWHHPTDVLCGWLLGSVGAMAVTIFARKN